MFLSLHNSVLWQQSEVNSPASRSWWGAVVQSGTRWRGSGGSPSRTCRCSGNRRRSRTWTAPWHLCEASGTAGSSCGRWWSEFLRCDWPRLAKNPGRSAAPPPPAGGVGAEERAGRWGFSWCSGFLTSTTTPGTAGRRRPWRGRWRGTRPRPSPLVTSTTTLAAAGCKQKNNALWVADSGPHAKIFSYP